MTSLWRRRPSFVEHSTVIIVAVPPAMAGVQGTVRDIALEKDTFFLVTSTGQHVALASLTCGVTGMVR